MPYPSKKLEDYQELGESLKLELVGDPPKSVYDKATWKCQKCGETFARPFHKLRYASIGHRCQSDKSMTRQEYIALEQKLGIRWTGSYVPAKTKLPTDWIGSNNQPFTASYHQLAYPQFTPSRFFMYLSPEAVADILAQRKTKRTPDGRRAHP
jgi:hypothetical protein